ncbi:DUF1254 domain-containing protein [Marinilabiliaceae bacterium JC017]|nr:DUF1254 domain-containing protein [Marinilabiliaceae bacterium JC017]
MKRLFKNILLVCMIALIASSCMQKKQEAEEKCCTKEFEYLGGYPTQATIQKAYDQLDVQRATQAYIEFMPLASQNAIFESLIHEYDLVSPGDVGIYIEPGAGKSEAIGLTYNTESVYATAYTDLLKDGPTVVETPPNVLGMVDDTFMRFITDLGNAGPDKGKGGKYLLLPPGYKGEIPEGYFVYECPTYRNWVMVRGFVQDTGTGEAAIEYYRENFKAYPLSTGVREDARYLSLSYKAGNSTHPRDVSYYDLLNKVVQYEPVSAFTAYELGLLKAIGIEKGKTFNPNERMKNMLADGVKVGDAIAKTNAYAHRDKRARIYSDRKYETIFIGGSHEFMEGDAMLLDARTLFHYEAIVITPAMARKMVGVGSQYLCCYRDAEADFLMGDNNYKLHLPSGIPAKDFWSVTVYHPDTRSLLQNDQPKPSVSTYDEPVVNEDGSIDLYFGPDKAPEGFEKNWVKTIPGEGWFLYIRLYGPLESFFDQTWKPDDIVKLN